MNEQRRVSLFAPQEIPTALKVVAWLWIVFGWLGVLGFLTDLMFESKLSINLAILGVFVGPGLLKLKPGWRTCALVLSWITLVLMGLMSCLFLGIFTTGPGGSFTMNMFGKTSSLSSGLGVLMMLLMLVTQVAFAAVIYWEIKVLNRPDVRALFGCDSPLHYEGDNPDNIPPRYATNILDDIRETNCNDDDDASARIP